MQLGGGAQAIEYVAGAEDQGKKVIEIMARCMDLSSRMIRRCKQEKLMMVNGEIRSVNSLVIKGDLITVQLEPEINIFNPEPIPVEIIYEDSDILVVNKAAGLVVHPTKGHPGGTLGNALAWYALKNGENYKIRFVNRLDRDTTGLVIIAKNGFAQQLISDRMQEGKVEKIYLALVHGCPEPDEGTVDAPIHRIQPEDITRQVHEDGKSCVTHYKVLAKLKGAALLQLNLETGRTHQIRVHMQYIGNPLFGDPLYGNTKADAMERQALHAWKLNFETPRRGKICLTAPIPDDILKCVESLDGEGLLEELL